MYYTFDCGIIIVMYLMIFNRKETRDWIFLMAFTYHSTTNRS